VQTVSVAERRARLARRHRLAPDSLAADVESAAAAVVGLHATDPATVYLSARARVDGMSVTDMDEALYSRRSLVKHLAMRRTLFVFPTAGLDVVQAAASARIAAAETGRLAREVEKAGLYDDGAAWLEKASKAVLAHLADGREASWVQLREELPVLGGRISYGEGRSWGGEYPVGPRVLNVLSAAGRIVRAGNDGGWTASRPRWATTRSWIGRDLDVPDEAEAMAELVRRWLRAFGPGTERDLRWWLGATAAAVRRALRAVAAVEVDLGGSVGLLLPDDLEPEPPVEPWAALLPGLDPTVMAWTERDWYLGRHREQLFDRNGNGGPTAWWDGRIVGGWHQTPSGRVVVDLLERVDPHARRALEHEAERLTGWLSGVLVTLRFPSPLAQQARSGALDARP
jgi:hypothetical protein